MCHFDMFSCANPQAGAEQFVSCVEFEIGQNNRYEIYPDMNFMSFLNM